MKKLPLILIAEDDEDDQMLMKSAFKDNKVECQLEFVPDGEKLMEYLEASETIPSLILLDLNMPKVDGKAVLKIIKDSEVYRHIPTMIISTSSAVAEVKNVYNLGAAAYLVKPANYDDLLKLINHLTSFYFNAATLSQA
ncbi:response regulator [uncultured Arcticibacterium sp.]|uniref:response regulator n=1 Tax=uncultured Arcticibacterium sp. TaxID=2173042 RepID=UPI0030F9C8FE